MRKLLVGVVVLALLALAVQQFDLLGDGGGKAGETLRSGIHDLTGKTAADLGRETKTYAARARIARAVREYVSETGRLPRRLDELVDRGLVQKDMLLDEWGRGLAIEADGERITLRSAGADGDFHTGDDWTLDL